jgi:DMSO/TMAO reductase YedYZ molybdopterin-dependent catalytic subunit
MTFISRGSRGRPRDQAAGGRLPPGQYLERAFPVLSAGPTPRTRLADWTFSITGEVDEPRRWTWDELRRLPTETITRDIHCVTKWSKLDTVWEGVSVDTLLDGIDTSAEYVLALADGGYTTNLPLADVTDGKAWVALAFGGAPLAPEQRRPGAAFGAAPVLLEERQVAARPPADGRGRARLLGDLRLPQLR